MHRRQRITLEALRLVDAIDRLGSFAAAAQETFVVTSSVTHAVRNLESNLGLVLFDRSGRRARLTAEGRALLDKGRALLEQADAFDADMQVLATGWEPSLVLAVDAVVRLDAVLALADAFFRAAPGTSLHVRREAAAGTWDALTAGRADLAIGAPDAGPPGGGYVAVPLGRIRFVFAAAAGHPLARHAGPLGEADLVPHRAVVLTDTTRELPRLTRGLLAHRHTLAVPDEEAKLAAILSGAGCGFVPERLARAHVRAKRLVVLRVETPPPPAQSTLAWRAGATGRAIGWWVKHLTAPRMAAKLLY